MAGPGGGGESCTLKTLWLVFKNICCKIAPESRDFSKLHSWTQSTGSMEVAAMSRSNTAREGNIVENRGKINRGW